MYKLRCTIKCPNHMKDKLIEALNKIDINEIEVEEIPYETFIEESRLYWDYVFSEMLEDHQPVTYLSYEFDDTDEGRKASHFAEWSIGWIPQNIRYVEK
ncbi:MAG: hypothetical protein ACI4U3_10250 [Traorella sp.]